MKYLLWISLLSVLTQSLVAQDGNFRDKVADIKRKKLIETLDLSKDKQPAFFKTYDGYRDRRRALQKERKELMDRLSHMAAIADEVSSDKIAATIGEINALDKRIIEEREKVLAEVKPLLTHGQLAKFVLFEQNFSYKLREMIFDVRKEKMKHKLFLDDEDWPD